ncbi:MAG: 2-phospho-L-lactate transferase [Rhodospirillaceae bacterium]|jgi:LPPG:FO 2-phospho-L-lactate transferase|nr:2-phospho-L-lactate transferase [Rhodospirillaceae bacterium]MBT4932352.1 2-phospho-L-lactate transferase [Rhodospirillaceae bacterium]MBT5242817.1 2-phospho-L-lactate transferase [Rhodospirillaceae bacterium]MBT5564018.1 2-phospho-L-lactate transferase [Rhodospirillaceae bacterium]MBT6243293.1 2-phospho-L-lactate transferase [Rhodospirillaceae bacterium]
MSRSQDSISTRPRVLALSGGIGGAKLALGLYRILEPWQLAVVVNTGDDFEHLGLHISPDVDTLMYTLSGENNTELGWGRAGETWVFLEQLKRLGGETWFQLGDGDLAVHIRRTESLKQDHTLSAITADLFLRMGIEAHAWPMSDQSVRTMVDTADGQVLPFQNYFVGQLCKPEVSGFRFTGAQTAKPNQSFLRLLGDPKLDAVIICPSNPFVSVDPILAIPGVREALKACPVPVIAISPIVGGEAVKGPTAKMMRELKMDVNPLSVAGHYAGLLDGFVLDDADAGYRDSLEISSLVTSTVMQTLADRDTLARDVLAFAEQLKAKELSLPVVARGAL